MGRSPAADRSAHSLHHCRGDVTTSSGVPFFRAAIQKMHIYNILTTERVKAQNAWITEEAADISGQSLNLMHLYCVLGSIVGLHPAPWQMQCALKALHLCSERQQLLPIFPSIRREFYVQSTQKPRTHISDTGWGGEDFSAAQLKCSSNDLWGFAKEIHCAAKHILQQQEVAQKFTNIPNCCARLVKFGIAHPYFQHWELISTTRTIVFFWSIFYYTSKYKTKQQRKAIFSKLFLLNKLLSIVMVSFFLWFLICSWFTFFS